MTSKQGQSGIRSGAAMPGRTLRIERSDRDADGGIMTEGKHWHRSVTLRAQSAWLGSVLLISACSCSMTAERAITLGQAVDPKAVVKNQGELLKYLENPNKSDGIDTATRARALESVVALDKERESSKQSPELRRRTVALLIRESRAPWSGNGATASEENKDYIQALSLQYLGRLADDEVLDTILSELSNKDESRLGPQARVAALGALVENRCAVKASTALRRKLFEELVRMRSAQPLNSVSAEHARNIARLAAVLDAELDDVEIMTDLLTHEAQNQAGGTLREALRKDYSLLIYHAEKNIPIKPATMDANIESLWAISMGDDGPSATDARKVLSTIAPLTYLHRLAARTQGHEQVQPRSHLVHEFALMLPVGDEIAGAYGTANENQFRQLSGQWMLNESRLALAHGESRKKMVAQLLTAADGCDPKEREFVYSQLITRDPVAIISHLKSIGASRMAAKPEEAQGFVVFVGTLAPHLGKGPRDEMVDLLCSGMNQRSAAVRRTVSAHVRQLSSPARLLQACMPAMRDIAGDPPDAAKELLSIYISTLKSIDQANVDLGHEPQAPDLGFDSPLAHLDNVFDRPERPLKMMAVGFLRERAPEILLRSLSVRVAKQTTEAPTKAGIWKENVVLLGDIAATPNDSIQGTSREEAFRSLVNALPMLTEDEALQVARSLIESRSDLAQSLLRDSIHSGSVSWPAVTALASLSTSSNSASLANSISP